jgi:hypothetical protein
MSEGAGDTDGAAVRAAWRAEEARWSQAAFEQWEHSRGLTDVAREAMHRGDRVAFAYEALVWAGVVVAVGRDVARIDTGGSLVDVRLDDAAPFVLRTGRGTGDGCRGRALVSFAARLRELDGSNVMLGASGGSLEGTLRIGRDQVRVRAADGSSAYAPRGSVWWVRVVEDD